MLVLTRKHQEKIRIGDHITITVLKTKGKTVRLGIEAPAEVPVIRGELSFEGHAVEWQAEASDDEVESPRVVTEGSHVDRVRAHWPTKQRSNGAADRPVAEGASRVTLERVPRDQVSQVLPKLVAGAGPLRAMVARRSVSA